MDWIRNCPKCKKKILYNSKLTYDRACKKSTICYSCNTIKLWENEIYRNKNTKSRIGKKQTLESNLKRSNSLLGRIFTDEHRRKIGLKHKGKIVSCTTRELLSKCRKGIAWTGRHTNEFKLELSSRSKNNKIWLGRKHTDETKKKQRIARINDILKKYGIAYPNFNQNACKIIDVYGKKNGYNFRHAMNGGEFYISELGYWVDGYDKNRNTVIEYYEKAHNTQVLHDLQRENEICNYLGCDFIIVWE